MAFIKPIQSLINRIIILHCIYTVYMAMMSSHRFSGPKNTILSLNIITAYCSSNTFNLYRYSLAVAK